MLKEPEVSRYAGRRTHRTYSREFKAEMVAACLQPGTSVAALALSRGMNANGGCPEFCVNGASVKSWASSLQTGW